MTARSIARIVSHPLRAVLAKSQRTSQGDYPAIEIVVVEVTSSDGIVGYGEGLARRGAAAYAHLIDEVLTPRLIGKDPADRRALWKTMRAALSGRPGGQLVEAISAVDIALWDIAGKAANQPIHKLLGGMGRTRVAAYASSIKAETAWKLLSGRFPQVAALQKSVVTATVGGKSIVRLRAVGSTDQTRAACAALKAAGENCLAVN